MRVFSLSSLFVTSDETDQHWKNGNYLHVSHIPEAVAPYTVKLIQIIINRYAHYCVLAHVLSTKDAIPGVASWEIRLC